MNTQLGPPRPARSCKQSVESLGIAVHLDVPTTDVIGRRTRSRGVGLADGRRLDCDLLVVAAGIRPNTDLAVRSAA